MTPIKASTHVASPAEPPAIPELPDLQAFCVNLPLYAGHPVPIQRWPQLWDLITKDGTIDCFCLECEQPSVFSGKGKELAMMPSSIMRHNLQFTRLFTCSRDQSHTVCFFFVFRAKVLTKVGQDPSLADLVETEVRAYRKVLSQEDYHELTKAVGLAAHGVGIGSFVYLRRIFERLIDEARSQAIKDSGWDESVFQKARMEEKIELLKAHLPAFLVEQRRLYNILSKGIHSLSESECKDAFPILKAGIELILDEKAAERTRQDKIKQAKIQIAELERKLKS